MYTVNGAGNRVAATPQTYAADKQADQSPRAGMDSNLFLQLLVAQMRYQDPLSSDQDAGQMISQLAMFTLLEQVVKVQQAVQKQGYATEQTTALNLLNRTVEVLDGEGAVVSGTVTAVNFRNQQPYLTVEGKEYSFSALIRAEGGSNDGG